MMDIGSRTGIGINSRVVVAVVRAAQIVRT